MLESVIGVLAKVPIGIPGTEAITGAVIESETVDFIAGINKIKRTLKTDK